MLALRGSGERALTSHSCASQVPVTLVAYSLVWQIHSMEFVIGTLPTVTQVCNVEQNTAPFASNWVPMWAGAVEAGSPQVRFRGSTCLVPHGVQLGVVPVKRVSW